MQLESLAPGLRNPETETHPKPLSKRVQNGSLATLSGHLKGGVHDRPFKLTFPGVLAGRAF